MKKKPVVFPPSERKTDSRISKAPSPISPIDGNAIDTLPRYELKSPDWNRWRLLDKSELWKAACLAANIEPPTDIDGDLWYERQLRSLTPRFIKIWEAVNADYVFSRLPPVNDSGRMLYRVGICWFADWAKKKGIEIPAEMEEMSSSTRSPLRDSIDVATWEAKDLWREDEFAALLCGISPGTMPLGRARESEDWMKASSAIHRAISVEALVVAAWLQDDYEPGRFEAPAIRPHFAPAEAVRWAAGKRSEFPSFPVFPRFETLVKQAEARAVTKASLQPLSSEQPIEPSAESGRLHRLKSRRDILDPAIDKAIKNVGSFDCAAVFLQLRELAISEEQPFTGVVEGNALCYTNVNGQAANFTKGALEKRLERRQKAESKR